MENMKSFRKIFIFLQIFITLVGISKLYATEKYENLNPDDVFSMSIEEMLQVVVVTASKHEEKISDIPASVVIFTRSDIERYGFVNLEEILENVPGMYKIDDMSAYKPVFGVRGFWSGSPKNIIIMINGVTQTEGIFDNFALTQFNIPVESIDKIEVIRGPMSVIYGPGSFYGAINIITNEKSSEVLKNIISVSYGTYGTKKTSLHSRGQEGDINFTFNAGYSSTDGQNEPLSIMSSKVDTLPYINSTNNNTKNRLENDSKHINISVYYKNFSANMSFNKSNDEIYGLFPTFSGGSSYLRETAKMKVGYEKKFSDFFTLTAKATYHNFRFRVNFDWFNFADSGYTSGESNIYEGELNTYFNFSDNLHLINGLYLKRISDNLMDANLHNVKIYTKNSALDYTDLLAFYSQIDFKPLDKLRLVAGFRLEQLLNYDILLANNPGKENSYYKTDTYEEDSVDFIPRLAAIISINEKNILKLLYGKAITRPSFFQNTDQITSASPDLHPEKIQTFELNYIAVPFPVLTINTSIFSNILDNLVVRTFELQSDKSIKTFSVNAGKMITNGIEFTIQTQPVESLLVELSASYQRTNDKREGFENISVEYSPHFLGYFKGSYKFNNNITFALIANFVDEMETHWKVDEINPDGTYGKRIGDRTDSFFTISTNLRVDDIVGKGFFFNLHCSNLLNEKYLFPTYTTNSNWMDKGAIGDPFSVLLTLGRKF